MTTPNKLLDLSTPLATPTRPRATTSLWRAVWKHRIEYLLISPFFIIFTIFHGYPLVWALWLSFQRWQGIGEPKWFGLGNYERLLNSDHIWKALGNSLIFLVI